VNEGALAHWGAVAPKEKENKSNPITGLDSHWGFQELQARIFQDSRYMKVVRCQLHSPAAFTLQEIHLVLIYVGG